MSSDPRGLPRLDDLPRFPQGPTEVPVAFTCTYCRTGELRSDLVVYRCGVDNQPRGRRHFLCPEHRAAFEEKYSRD